MSLLSLLSIARSALLSHQRAMAVTGHNVANAMTPGYSRQRLQMSAADPLRIPEGLIGRGVTTQGIARMRDLFSDATFRRESGLLGSSSQMRDLLGQVEGAFNEPSELGVGAALDGLFQAFGDLANDPASTVNRNLLRQAAGSFTSRLHQLDSELSSASADALNRMRSQADDVNGLTSRIADLNVQILASGGTSHSAPDLEDQRDLLVDQLSQVLAVRVIGRDDGSIAVMAGDAMLVDGANRQAVDVRPVGSGFGLGITGSSTTVDPGAGSLKALVDLVNTTLPGLRAKLDQFASAIVTEVNAIHRSGFTLAGATGTDFFDSAGVTAGSISLTAAISASGDAIAAGGTNAPGDNTVAQRIAALSTTALASLGGKTLRDLYTELSGSVGILTRDAEQNEAIQQALVDRSDDQRNSVSGVSVDEEMTLLLGQQQAYSAAARLIVVADEMMQELLNIL